MSPAAAALPPPTWTAVHSTVTQSAAPHGWEPHTVRAGDTISTLALRHGTTVAAIVARNNLAAGGHLITIGSKVDVPRTSPQKSSAGTSRSAKKSASGKASSKARGRGAATVTVRRGDTLSDLAIRHGVSVAALARLNGISNVRMIFPGQKLRLDGRAKAPSTAGAGARSTGTKASTRSARSITVRAGDTLSDLALRHRVSVSALARANRISDPRVIHVGQKLTVPGTGGSSSSNGGKASSAGASSRSSNAPTGRYSVRAGETLSGIAARHGVSLAALLGANRGIDPHRLAVGQKIALPAVAGGKVQPWTADTIGDHKSDQDVNDRFLHYTYPSATARSAAANRDLLAAAPVPSPAETRQLITATAKRHGVDHRLVLAVGMTESGWNQRSVSPANAIGIMQVIPSSGEWASQLAGRELNLLDPEDNVTAGVVIIRSLLRAADNDAEAIGGYYQGLAGIQRNGMYADTKNYVKTVQALRSRM